MSSAREALLKKFARLSPASSHPAGERPRSGQLHRSKGKRHRLTLRLSLDVARGLRTLKVALGIDMNTLCEEAVAKEVAGRLAEAKAQSQPGEWDVIVRCALGKR